MKLFISLFLYSLSLTIAGPDVTTQTISWNSSKVTQISTGTISNDQQKMIVYKKERMEWIDAKGEKKYVLTIQSSKGALQIDGQGEVIYQVTGDNVRGNVTLKKAATQTLIKAVLVENNKPGIYELLVSGYTIL